MGRVLEISDCRVSLYAKFTVNNAAHVNLYPPHTQTQIQAKTFRRGKAEWK